MLICFEVLSSACRV